MLPDHFIGLGHPEPTGFSAEFSAGGKFEGLGFDDDGFLDDLLFDFVVVVLLGTVDALELVDAAFLGDHLRRFIFAGR